MMLLPAFVHPLCVDGEALPQAFTFPFRYEPHPLAVKAMKEVQDYLSKWVLKEGKMFGVLVVETSPKEYGFLAAFSGQFECGEDAYFVPPVYDYSAPTHYFQQEQREIVALNAQIDGFKRKPEYVEVESSLDACVKQRDEAISFAKQKYQEGKVQRQRLRSQGFDEAQLVRESQFQKAEIVRVKRQYAAKINVLQEKKKQLDEALKGLIEERKKRSEDLQEWLFAQFQFFNAKGEKQGLHHLFAATSIPSGAGECCAPKLLQAAYLHHLKPLCMAEFWWGPPSADLDRLPGVCYPACHRKCGPILSFMLQGLHVEADPALHYDGLRPKMEVVWEDAHIAVVCKPEGMLSVPGKSDIPNVLDEALRCWPSIELPVIIHRLDMDTSGLMVIAKTKRAYHFLQKEFEERKVEKRYVAILVGTPAHAKGVIALPLSPDYDNLPRQQVKAGGAEAETHYEVLAIEGERTRVALRPVTGRTHQLRVHASHLQGLNCPIMGDRLYGRLADRLYLHAEYLSFLHPITGERLTFTVPAPF